MRYVYNSRRKNRENRIKKTLTCEEVDAAETKVIKDMQSIMFTEELRCLRDNRTVPSSSKLSSLSPFIDDSGLLRVGGRLGSAPLPSETKHPYILPKDHTLTDMIIREEHVNKGHVGIEHVLANLRQFCWIVRGRVAIKRVIRKCFLCQTRRAKQQYPFMADLPGARIAYDDPPFSLAESLRSCLVQTKLFGSLKSARRTERMFDQLPNYFGWKIMTRFLKGRSMLATNANKPPFFLQHT